MRYRVILKRSDQVELACREAAPTAELAARAALVRHAPGCVVSVTARHVGVYLMMAQHAASRQAVGFIATVTLDEPASALVVDTNGLLQPATNALGGEASHA